MARLTVEQADRLAQERPPYPPPSDMPAEQCPGPTRWHRPEPEDWNRGNRESTCTWCQVPIGRNFGDPVWRELSIKGASMVGDVTVTVTWMDGTQETIEGYTARAQDGVLHITQRMHSGRPDRHIPLLNVRHYTTREQ